MPKAAKQKRDAVLMRVHLNLSRRLWRKFKASVAERGDTLTRRVTFLVERDLEEARAESASA